MAWGPGCPGEWGSRAKLQIDHQCLKFFLNLPKHHQANQTRVTHMEAIDFTPNFGRGHFDPNSPLSLHSKLGSHWAGRFMGKLAELNGADEYLCDEIVLKDWLEKTHHYIPNDNDERYRLQFWLEYENSVKLSRQMNMANVYNLVGPESSFHNLVMKDARRVAWMLSKPVSYAMGCNELLNSGMRRWKRLLAQDPFQPDPKDPSKMIIDYKLIDKQTKITMHMDLRLNGAPTQKIQSLSISATMGANGEIQELVDQGDAAAITRRMEDLRKRKRQAEGRGADKQDGGEAPSPPPADYIVTSGRDVTNEVAKEVASYEESNSVEGSGR